MKKVLKVLSTSVVGASLMLGVASADISNTGPGSSNTQTTTTNNSSTVTNNNTCNIKNTSTQNASSGNANNSGNTNSGNSSSGSANNSNSTSTSCTINGVSYPLNTPAQRTAAAKALAGGKGASQQAAQVVTPEGAVHAGAGGAPSSLGLATVAGLTASMGAIVAGVSLRKKALLG